MTSRLRQFARPFFWLCATAILLLSLVPPQVPTPSTGWDKGNHFLAFLVLAVLACEAWRIAAWRIAAALLAYGAAIEVIQGLLPYRHADLVDVVADLAGIGAGMAVWALARRSQSAS